MKQSSASEVLEIQPQVRLTCLITNQKIAACGNSCPLFHLFLAAFDVLKSRPVYANVLAAHHAEFVP